MGVAESVLSGGYGVGPRVGPSWESHHAQQGSGMRPPATVEINLWGGPCLPANPRLFFLVSALPLASGR